MKIIKNLWNLRKLAKKDQADIDKLLSVPQNIIDKMSESNSKRNAVYIPEGTQEDFERFQNEQSGMNKWIERLKNLI